MSTTDETKPTGKSGRRKGKADRKKKPNVGQSPSPVELRNPEPVQPQSLPSQPEPAVVESPVVDQPTLAAEPVENVAPIEAVEAVAILPEPEPEAAPSPIESVTAAPPTAEPAVAASPSEPTAAATPTEPAPVSLQTIANAYRDYTRKSIEDFGSFVEQLSGVRTLDKAMTVQSEFVKRAYETSVAESQKICELHNKLAKQTLQPFQGLMGKTPETRRKP
jgi:phasin family protein